MTPRRRPRRPYRTLIRVQQNPYGQATITAVMLRQIGARPGDYLAVHANQYRIVIKRVVIAW